MRILATSREALGPRRRARFALRSLTSPPRPLAATCAAIEASDAVRLFVDRARAAVPSSGSMPLAPPPWPRSAAASTESPSRIELAAARVKILSVEQIRVEAGRPVPPAHGGRRGARATPDAPAAIQWSYELLPTTSSAC
jgi:non-specific serine/threonine protein kinase